MLQAHSTAELKEMNISSNPDSSLINHHLMTIGKLVGNAAACDAVLFSTFKIISTCEFKIAHAIYYSSEALSTKKQIIRRILAANADSEEEKIVEAIIKSVEAAQNQRNEVSHALLAMGTNDEGVVNFNPRRQSQAKKPVTAAFLDSLLKQSGKACVDAYKAYDELCKKRKIPTKIDFQ